MTEQHEQNEHKRILVALDPAVPSGSALEVMVSLGKGIRAELLGLFVEDINMLRVASLPVVREVSVVSGATRPMETARVERQLRARAREVRRRFEQAARQLRMRHSFKVARGEVVAEVRRAAEEADLVILSRAHRSAGHRSWFGATIYQVALPGENTVVIVQEEWRTGSQVIVVREPGTGYSEALTMGTRIAAGEGLSLTILDSVLSGSGSRRAAEPGGGLVRKPIENLRVPQITSRELAAIALGKDARVLVLPRHHPEVSEELIRELLDQVECSLVLTGANS